SGPLTMAAVALAAAWLFFLGVSYWRYSDFPHAFIVIAAVLWLVSYWTQSAGARHLLLLSLVFYGVLLAGEIDILRVGPVMATISAILFAASVAAPREVDRIARVD